MYKRVEISSCKIAVDENKDYIYRYFLLENLKSIDVDGMEVRVPCYGIEIISEELINGRIVYIEGDNVGVVSSVRSKVIDLIEYLKNNSVSPVHLVGIIGEYADEWVDDIEKDARSLLNISILA